VLHDLLGLFDRFTPKFVKRYAEIGRAAGDAIGEYVREVRSGAFPDDAHSFLLRAEGGDTGDGSRPTRRKRAVA
jgi:3-methyl-2-oxobutanoate hydroxymethyltransferase